MSIVLLLLVAAYSRLILRRRAAWSRMQPVELPPNFQPATRLSVIIAVRNEAGHILALLQDLQRQTYPHALLEVLVIDDYSDDGTAELVEQYKAAAGYTLKLLRLSGQCGKKAAIKKGVAQARGRLLVFTDGDCRVQPDWLAYFAFTFTSRKACFISGPVGFHNTRSLFERMQLVEFAALIGIGGASIALGKPNMCNGANLAYTRRAFKRAGGFSGNEGVASGDDEFLLHKINRLYPQQIVFLKQPGAIVYTRACKTLPGFIAQRVRWAGKWKAYEQRQVQLLALLVCMVNLALFVAIPLVLTGGMPCWVFIWSYSAKFAVDFLFLAPVLTFLSRRPYLVYMLPLQLLYIPYVVFTAFRGLSGRYSWKGRSIHNT